MLPIKNAFAQTNVKTFYLNMPIKKSTLKFKIVKFITALPS